MWHYTKKEEIVCKNDNDLRAGTYLVYDIDTFDYLINDNDWIFQNNAFDEQSYILDYLDYMLESDDGELVYIPDARTATKRETEEAILEMETDTYY